MGLQGLGHCIPRRRQGPWGTEAEKSKRASSGAELGETNLSLVAQPVMNPAALQADSLLSDVCTIPGRVPIIPSVMGWLHSDDLAL